MLVDVELHGRKDPIADIVSDGLQPIRDRLGSYICNHWNFLLFTDVECKHYIKLSDGNYYSGVCDNIDQFFEHSVGKEILKDPKRKFTVSFVHISKKNQPSEDGWRWHKWGALYW
jgi:hypothetical protein